LRTPFSDLWRGQLRPTKVTGVLEKQESWCTGNTELTCLVRHLCHFVGIQQGPREHSPGSGRDAGDDDMYRLRKFSNEEGSGCKRMMD
jgi:hypothetical protein